MVLNDQHSAKIEHAVGFSTLGSQADSFQVHILIFRASILVTREQGVRFIEAPLRRAARAAKRRASRSLRGQIHNAFCRCGTASVV